MRSWLAGGLRATGIGRGDRIGILAANCLEWVLLDLAALRLGAVTAGFEPGKFDPEPALLSRYRLAALFTDRAPASRAPASRAPAGRATGGGIRPVSDVAGLIEL